MFCNFQVKGGTHRVGPIDLSTLFSLMLLVYIFNPTTHHAYCGEDYDDDGVDDNDEDETFFEENLFLR